MEKIGIFEEDTIKFALRIPKSMYESIIKSAAVNYRSTNNEILMAIASCLDSKPNVKKPSAN